MKRFCLLLGCVALGASMCVYAQDAPANPDQPSKEDVMKFLNLMHVRERMVQMMDGMKKAMQTGAETSFKQKVANPTPEQINGLHAITDVAFQDFPIDEMVDGMVPVYQRHISKTDLQTIIAFYSSPAGQRFLKEQPAMMTEGMQIGQDIMVKRLPEINRRVDEQIDKLIADQKEKASQQK